MVCSPRAVANCVRASHAHAQRLHVLCTVVRAIMVASQRRHGAALAWRVSKGMRARTHRTSPPYVSMSKHKHSSHWRAAPLHLRKLSPDPCSAAWGHSGSG